MDFEIYLAGQAMLQIRLDCILNVFEGSVQPVHAIARDEFNPI